MMGPERNQDWKACGDTLAEMLPTPFLEFRGGILHQWWEASAKQMDGHSINTIGEWRPVASRT